jgi:LPXTG-motif cell wall-anchored protein
MKLSDEVKEKVEKKDIPYRLFYFHQEKIDMLQGEIKEGTASAPLATCSGEDCVQHDATRGVMKIGSENLELGGEKSKDRRKESEYQSVKGYYFQIKEDLLHITSTHPDITLEMTRADRAWLEEGKLSTDQKPQPATKTATSAAGFQNPNIRGISTDDAEPTFELEDTIADVVIGQPDMYSRTPNNEGYSDRLFNNSHSIATDGTRLFVADYYNNRVLIYNSIPTSTYAPADLVIGQPDLTSNHMNYGGISARTLNSPIGVDTDGTRLFITDYGNHRILIYNSIPTSNFQPADVVLGQPDFASLGANQGGTTPTEFTVSKPYFIASNGTQLAIADSGNHRVLFYNSIPTTNGTAADLVLGQPDFVNNTANNGGRNAQSLYQPLGVDLHGSQLFITDYRNHRVLIHSTLPTANFEAADLVVGQASMTGGGAGNSANRLRNPFQTTTDGTRLFIADRNNHRALIFNTLPAGNGASADVVLGQQNMTSRVVNDGGISSQSLNAPTYAISDGSRLFVSDYNNRRILIHNSIPTTDFAAADVVLGKPDTSTGETVSAQSLRGYYDQTVTSDGTKLIVSDGRNCRILIWNKIPATNGTPADVVLGQPDMQSNTCNNGDVTAQSLNTLTDIDTDGTRLVAADRNNCRVLIWNTIPTTNFTPADIVLGQPDFTTRTCNNGGVSAHSLSGPFRTDIHEDKLIITDAWNHRVLIHNAFPVSNNEEADVVIGQPNFTSNTANNGGVSNQSINHGAEVSYDGEKLAIADNHNNRVLIFNNLPTTNFQPADIVIGQPDFVSNDANNGGLSSNSVYFPHSVTLYNKTLFVSDSGNNRLLIFDTDAITNNSPADIVLGQPNFTSNTGTSAITLNRPYGEVVADNKLVVSDQNNARVLIFNGVASPTPTNIPAPTATPEPEEPEPNQPEGPTPTLAYNSRPILTTFPQTDTDNQNTDEDDNDSDNSSDDEDSDPSPTPTVMYSQAGVDQPILPNTGSGSFTYLLILLDSAIVFLILFLIHRKKKTGEKEKHYTFVNDWVKSISRWKKKV